MVPDGVGEEAGARLIQPSVMGTPIVWLCPAEARGVRGERIVATEFDDWLAARR